ncbi:uncharacterized protein LOC127110547 [Lathyrus oleraceus]|uniref:uncharacterized protein LOC127110547 n=1 Tax=Pisum sativum TaxID=3888 RepID=UPI0021D10BF8|nr:uncharacterized protein LOC127110547 [Pisum sativum]KAI5382333.1 hypothetical protein KIW84_UN0029 [Pisum sativum]
MADENESVISESSKKRGFLNNEDRKAICQILLCSSDANGNLIGIGVVERVAASYNVHRSFIYRIWKQLKDTGNVCHNRTQNCGRKRVQLDLELMCQVPLSKRSTYRSLACALNIPKTSLVRLHKVGVIRRHTNTLKPYLKEDNMIARLRFCLSMIDKNSLPHDPKFISMHNIVFIDEKWFYITRNKVTNYLHVDEEEPHRTCKSKIFISKVMFLCAVTRPRFDNEENETYSGKIGIFPFVYEQPARRSSVNRVAGTIETKPIASVTREVNKAYLINKVLPAIENMWPREDVGKKIFIQQDNARSHINKDDPDFCRAASESEFDIQLTCQPPNSPDLNVLDLGFFNAIQSLQQKEPVKSIDELVGAVQKAFDEFSTVQSNKIFSTLQSCMIEIMKINGSNKYKIPHMKKDMLYKQGGIPVQMSCDSSLVQEVTEYLQNYDS